MSWERIKDVYAFSPPDVSATDQAVLVALAFRTN